MERFQRILVCIDEPERDARMLPYVRAVARLAEAGEIHLLHVAATPVAAAPVVDAPAVGAPAVGTPDQAAAATSDESAGAVPVTAEALRRIAGEQLKDLPPHKCVCEVVPGAPLLEILRYAHDKDVDLIVIERHHGQVSETDDTALLARRVTRKATCSVLVLPDTYRLKADAILVPVRDSECSAGALDVACGIAAAAEATVIAFNVYQVHPGYSRVGKTLEEHQALLEAAAEQENASLLKRLDRPLDAVQSRYAPDLHDKPVPIILEAIDRLAADVVVIGARGRTGAAGVLLGNITEQLIQQSPVPVLAVKKKGECIGVLRALLTITSEG
ncbi:MAG TPA: universal stress protein [Phycisphaerae bacterium]|nr:universal stress protein [Phycisphaerae bacterium]